MNYILIALISYLFGSFPTALIVVYLFTKKDVRSSGSGNMGAMNTLRMIKKERGIALAFVGFLIVWIFDMSKAVIVSLISLSLVHDFIPVITISSFFAILGHNYPIWLKGKGGRGAASLMGIIIYYHLPVFIYWIMTIFLASVVFEYIYRIINHQKTDFEMIPYAISEQIIGRLIGEVIAIYVVYLLDQRLFLPVLLGTILIIYRHKERVIKQINKINS